MSEPGACAVGIRDSEFSLSLIPTAQAPSRMTEPDPARPPTVFIGAQVSQENLRKFVTQYTESTWFIKAVMNRDPHLETPKTAICGRESPVCG